MKACGKNRQDDFLVQGSLIGLALGLATASASLSLFGGGSEKQVFWREASNGQSILAYGLGKLLVELPSLFLSSALFTVVFAILVTFILPFCQFVERNYLFIYLFIYFKNRLHQQLMF